MKKVFLCFMSFLLTLGILGACGESNTSQSEARSIEEIQEYKMNVETKTEKYKRLINDFTDAVDDENLDDVKKLYNELKVMLRPESQERKLIDIDMRMVQGND